MTKYQLISNGTYLTLSDDINISLTYQIDDILNISERPTNWSRSITLPGDATNNKFFKHIFDVNVNAVSFNPIKKVPIILRVGDNTIFTGNLQLEKISVIHELIEYQVSIYGLLNNINSLIADKFVHELDVSEFNHIRDRYTIIESHDYNVIQNGSMSYHDGPGIGYVYPYIIYGNDTAFSGNINIYEAFPALYSTQLFKKIITENGYKIKSEFLESEYAKKLILPYTADKIQMTDEQVDNFGSVIGITTEMTDATPYLNRGYNWLYVGNLPGWDRESGTVDSSNGELTFKDNLNQYIPGVTIASGNGFWTCQNQGYYDVNFKGTGYGKYIHDDGDDVNYNEGTGSFEYIFKLFVIRANTGVHEPLAQSDGGTQLFTPGGGSHASPWTDKSVPLTFDLSRSHVQLSIGDIVYYKYGFRYPDTVKWTGTTNDKVKAKLVFDRQVGNDYSSFQIVPTSNIDMGNQLIDMNQCLPLNYKQTDLIGDYVKMFDLIMTEDINDPMTLIIEPRDVYYSTNTKILEWDDIYDNDTGYKVTPMSEVDSNEYKFTYTADDDYYNKEYTNATKKIYGEYNINVGNDFSDKTNSTKVTLSPTPDASQYTGGRVAPMFVTLEDEGIKPKKVKNRILFYGGKIPTTFLYYQDYPAGPNTLLTYYPYVGMWDHPTSPEFDLGFGPTEKIYWDSYQFPVKNLFNQFHKNTVNNIINPNARLIEAKFHLTPKDIAQFDFRNVVSWEGAYWRVNEIKNYDPTADDKLTTVILYKILDAYTTDKITIVTPYTNNSCPVDMVTQKSGKNYIHISKSGLPVTKMCCDSVGGNYKNGVCYLGDYSLGDLDYSSATSSVPVSQPEGPSKGLVNNNIIKSTGNKTIGRNIYVEDGVEPSNLAIGSNINISKGAKNSLTIGENLVADKENIINLNGTIISDNGTIKPNFNMLQGPVDSVRNPYPYNPSFVKWKSGTDAVRDINFSSEINLFQGGRDSV